MNILIFGSSGFIGRQVTASLQHHTLITPSSRDIDFTKPDNLDLAKLETLMQNVDVVINLVGVMSNDKELMENVHHHTPFKIATLFKNNAKTQGVKTWINLSALGANPTHEVAFVGSKGHGDKAILSLAEMGNDEGFRVTIARPSLVFGSGGASTELFLMLAKLPILVLPNGGNFAIQPVSVQDVAQGLVNLALDKNTQDLPSIINFTGEKVITLAKYLGELRLKFYHKKPPVILNLPMPIAKFSARILQHFTNMISVDSLILLEQGNTADNADFMRLLEHEPYLVGA